VSGTPVLVVKDLKKSYESPDGERLTIVDVPAFSLGAGEQVALRGASGTGKTTFLNLIAGILTADGGEIEVAGKSMTDGGETDRDRLRGSSIGYIFQTFNLLQGFTALENVELGMMFGRGIDLGVAEKLLGRVGLANRLHYRPRQLSVGQQQRVAVARALAGRPALVLADEPTGNLDRSHSRGALSLIREVCLESGAALLLVSHDEEVLAQFERSEDLARINRASLGASAAGSGAAL